MVPASFIRKPRTRANLWGYGGPKAGNLQAKDDLNLLWEQRVARSNRAAPTSKNQILRRYKFPTKHPSREQSGSSSRCGCVSLELHTRRARDWGTSEPRGPARARGARGVHQPAATTSWGVRHRGQLTVRRPPPMPTAAAPSTSDRCRTARRCVARNATKDVPSWRPNPAAYGCVRPRRRLGIPTSKGGRVANWAE
jgi:hypothetical protein